MWQNIEWVTQVIPNHNPTQPSIRREGLLSLQALPSRRGWGEYNLINQFT